MKMRYKSGFTLAELLISLAILGVISAFAIPKVIVAQQAAKNNAIIKEAVGAVSGAYQRYQASGAVSGATGLNNVTPYINYIRVDTTSDIDNVQTQGTDSCTYLTCLRLHSGAIISYYSGQSFGGTSTTNAVWFHVDPDGRVTDGTTNGPGKSVPLFLYANGRLMDEGSILPGTTDNAQAYTAGTAGVPPWFTW